VRLTASEVCRLDKKKKPLKNVYDFSEMILGTWGLGNFKAAPPTITQH